MTNATMGGVITAVAMLILLIVVVAFVGPGHSVLLEGFDYIFEAINASRVGLGL